MRWRRRSLCLFAVWVLIETREALAVTNCLVRIDPRNISDPDQPPYWNDDSAQNLSDSNLHIQCTATEVNATFEYSGSKSNFDRRITSLYNDITWICQPASGGEEVYVCMEKSLLTGTDVEFSLNITGRGGWGSSCRMQGCVEQSGNLRHIRSNKCEIPGSPVASTVNPTTVTSTIATITNQTTVIEDKDKIQDNNINMLITKVLAPLMAVLIMLILLVLVVIVPLISVVHLRMRKYSCNWQAYGNPDLPFDPHYAPVDIEKPSFNPTPRLSLLSVDMFQNLYMARTNNITNGNMHIEPLAVPPNIHYNSSDSLDTPDAGEESGNERSSSALSEVSIPHTRTFLDDDGTLCKTVSDSSCQSSSVQYIQNVPLLRRPQSLKDDYQDTLQINVLNNLDYTDSGLVGIRGGDASCDVSDSLHFWEHNSAPLPSHSDLDPFSSLCAETTVQLDKAYVSSESGYIQSHDTNYSTAQSLFIPQVTNTDHDIMSNKGETVEQLTQVPKIILDNESIKSVDSSLNCYDIGVHSQTDTSDEEVDVLGLCDSDTKDYGDHQGYIKHEQHNITTEIGLIPYPSDIDLDFIPSLSGAVRPTSIDIHRASDYTPSDLSSGYVTTSCTSYDNGQQNNIMEMLFQQKLKDVKEESGTS